MNMPSRKTITATLFFTFIIVFFGFVVWYLAGVFGNADSVIDDPENNDRGFTFFPFGRGSDNDSGSTITPTDTDDPNVTNPIIDPSTSNPVIERFRLVADMPTAGATFFRRATNASSLFDISRQQETAIRYMAVETGHVFETNVESTVSTRISNTTIPRISEAHFIDFDSVIVRYVDPSTDVVKTFSGTLSDRTTEVSGADTTLQRLTGIFFPENIKDISINSEGQILYTQEDASGLSVITADSLAQNKQQIFSSPLTEWKPDWSGRETTVSLTQYPSAISYGATILLNSATQVARPYISGKQGLDTLLSPDASKALVSYKTDNGISLFVKDGDGELRATGIDTYAEKCVWSTDAVLVFCAVPSGNISDDAPDSWYQGRELHSDDVWRINTDTLQTDYLFSPFTEKSYSLDIFDMNLSADEKYLYFRDKENLYLWSYILEL